MLIFNCKWGTELGGLLSGCMGSCVGGDIPIFNKSVNRIKLYRLVQ